MNADTNKAVAALLLQAVALLDPTAVPTAQAPQVPTLPTPGATLPRPATAPAPKAPKAVALSRETRRSFVNAALEQRLADYSGMTCRQIAAAVVAGYPVPEGFRVAQGYRNLVA